MEFTAFLPNPNDNEEWNKSTGCVPGVLAVTKGSINDPCCILECFKAGSSLTLYSGDFDIGGMLSLSSLFVSSSRFLRLPIHAAKGEPGL